jgi:hypothetical protein
MFTGTERYDSFLCKTYLVKNLLPMHSPAQNLLLQYIYTISESYYMYIQARAESSFALRAGLGKAVIAQVNKDGQTLKVNVLHLLTKVQRHHVFAVRRPLLCLCVHIHLYEV